jgi:two-component system OmpR family response regulator
MYERRLIIIEDDKNIAQLVEQVAMDAGFETRLAMNDLSFIAIFESFKPHVLVLDVMMPGMDGFEVLQFLHGSDSKIRIIILSGDSHFRDMAAKLGAGLGLHIDAVLAKPFRIAELRLRLQEIGYSMENHPESAKQRLLRP